MDLDACETFLKATFGPAAMVPGEFGVTCRACDVVGRIGYATNLTPEVVGAAIEHEVDLVITHHDAWDFVYGMKAECIDLLTKGGISHLFAHLPLDAADFGTAAALGQALGGQVREKMASYEGFLCGRICALPEPVDLPDFVRRVEDVCEEPVQSWRNSDEPVRTFGVVPGGGALTSYVKECVDRECDLYITGEKDLYTVQYAQYAGIHLVVGSHTFTEVFGVEALVNLIASEYPEITAARLHEPHLASSV